MLETLIHTKRLQSPCKHCEISDIPHCRAVCDTLHNFIDYLDNNNFTAYGVTDTSDEYTLHL